MNERRSTLRNDLLKYVVRVAKLRLLCKYITLIEIKLYKKENRKEGCALSSEKPAVKGGVKPSKTVAQLVKNLPADAGDARDSGSMPGLGRSPGEGNSNVLQDSCLENSRDRGAWWATVHGVAKSQT